MAKTIEQLIQNRKDMINILKKNHAEDGIKSLLTDLYPDNAHFIYELLQNAEDMNATVVRFELFEDKLNFEHNGTKRDFNLHDIDAITNIGHNAQKKNDPTSIGKFGVGFKAVFAYTSTPEIHSGDYHFKIKDYFIPEFRGVKKVRTVDKDGVKWTKFSFPFNNPKKPIENAKKEITQSLVALDDSSILFLNNIKRIEYILPDASISYVERREDNKPFTDVVYKPLKRKEVITHWLKYSNNIEMTDEQGNLKKLNIAVAYKLEIEKTGTIKVVPIDGKVFIYFPAEKEYSGLNFHINAPFASTVARDSVRNCEDNKRLIKKVANLMTNSISSIKELGLLTPAFLDVLPYDGETPVFYNVFFDYLYTVFQAYPLLPTRYNKDYVSLKDGLVGPAAISTLFLDEDLPVFGYKNKKWIANPLRNTNGDKFIKGLKVQEFSYKEFSGLVSDRRLRLENFVHTKDLRWIKKFYYLCYETKRNMPSIYSFERNKYERIFINALKSMKILQSTDNTHLQFYKSDEIYILPKNETLLNKSTPIIHKQLYSPNNKEDNDIYSFLDMLDVEEYGQEVEINRLIDLYEYKVVESAEYANAILSFAEFHNNWYYRDYEFKGKRIFLGYKNSKLIACDASDIVLLPPYGNEHGSLLLKLYDKATLWDGYAKYLNQDKLSKVIEFIKECGAITHLVIEEQDVYYNPQYRKKLYSSANKNKNASEADYTINNIEEMVKKNDFRISKLIWDTLLSLKDESISVAHNRPNNSATRRECESTLFYYLLNNKWIPNKYGEFYAPGDIYPNDLHNDFRYEKNNKLIQALKLGNNLDNQTKLIKELRQEADKLGFTVIDKDELVEFEKFKEMKKKKAQRNDKFDLDQEMSKLNKNQIGDNVPLLQDDSLGNVKKREKYIEETFEDAKKLTPIQRKIVSRYESSSKEEKHVLFEWYRGKCQICGTSIRDNKGQAHFMAINIFDSKQLPQEIDGSIDLGWNSLCVCPNCAMKYRVCSKEMTDFFKEVEQSKFRDREYGMRELPIKIANEDIKITYAPKHLLSLQTVLNILKNKK